MSDFCSTFAPNLNTIMEKRTYIQPKMEMAVMPKDALMGDDLILSSSGSMGTVGGAPARDAAGPKDVMF